MKRVFILLAMSFVLAGRDTKAQDVTPVPTAPVPAAAPSAAPAAATAAAIAAQQAADERYKRMAADIEALQMDNESLKAKLVAYEQKIDDLRQQIAAARNTGVQEDLKRLAEKIAEVDKKREEDKQAISEEIRKSIAGLEKTLAGAPAPAPVHTPPAKITLDPVVAQTDDGFTYIIRDGDNLSAIVKAYNADFKSKGLKPITLKQAKEANPNVKWDRLLVGQKIIIPKPEGQ